MKRAVVGALLGTGLLLVGIVVAQQRTEPIGRGAATAPPVSGPLAGSDLIVVPGACSEKGQMLTIVDSRQRAMCVYQIDAAGKIVLKSARGIEWDLRTPEFNTENPLPTEVRSWLEQLKR